MARARRTSRRWRGSGGSTDGRLVLPYPFFIPPASVRETAPEVWTEEQRASYFDWLTTDACDARPADLLEYFKIPAKSGSHAEMLLAVGRKAAGALELDEHFVEGGSLSNRGYALAADLGLLVAHSICKDCPTVKWEIKGPPKSDFGYNMPVLTGFGSRYLEPVAGSIGAAAGILSGSKDFRSWFNIYRFWLDLARTHARTDTGEA